MQDDIIILRKLAFQYFELAFRDDNYEKMKLHRAVNDLKPIRPVVLIDELPWHEMNINDELTIKCNDVYLREIEWFFRSNIYKKNHLPADMVLPQFVPVQKIILSTGIGISITENILASDTNNHIVSHEYKDILQNEEDLAKLKNSVISYNKDETMRKYELVGNIIGDIMPVRLSGMGAFNFGPWDEISQYRGIANLFIDLIDRPEFMHKIVQRLAEIRMNELKQFEELNLLDLQLQNLHCTPAITSDLPGKDFDGVNLTRKNIWGRGFAQPFASVSKAMHEEFDINYMKQTIGQCGLVYYGCCEPLDKKLDIVEKIPNLRKISVTPWADVHAAAEAINTKYVLASKPNPSSVAVPKLDADKLKKELDCILSAVKRNNCACDIVLKDISTCCKRPENIFEWERTAMELVIQ